MNLSSDFFHPLPRQNVRRQAYPFTTVLHLPPMFTSRPSRDRCKIYTAYSFVTGSLVALLYRRRHARIQALPSCSSLPSPSSSRSGEEKG
ncbi:unnamed protein product [Brassica rapa]|uniref:Uncharacterized protein n=2 Tax=Brassica TaxID=3705 RepID=A0A8D9M7H2_BRACM|nr:unnamed protein product [Brassica napus]CAG7901211.1 unnamed protein product [Brassica rapa]